MLILNLISAFCIGSLTKRSMDARENAFLQQTNTSAKNQVEDYVEKYITMTEMLTLNGEIMSYIVNGSVRMGTVTDIPDYGWKLFAGMSRTEYSAAASEELSS